MEGRQLLQYLIDTSDVVLAKKQEATEYLAMVEYAAQQKRAADSRKRAELARKKSRKSQKVAPAKSG